MCKKMPFSDTNFEKSPYHGRGKPPPTPSIARSVASLPRFGPPLTNPGCTTVTGIAKCTWGHAPAPLALAPVDRPGCTTVTGIAKMHKGPWSPLIGVNEIFKRGNIYGIGTYATSHNYPLIMSFSVEENAVFMFTQIFKKSPYRGRGDTPPPTPPPPPRSLRSLGLGHFAPSHITAPLRWNPGYATDTPWCPTMLSQCHRLYNSPSWSLESQQCTFLGTRKIKHLQMAPEIVQGPNLKKVIYPYPLGSKNISLDSFSNTLNFNHTIHFPGKLTEFQHFNAQKVVFCTNISKRWLPGF